MSPNPVPSQSLQTFSLKAYWRNIESAPELQVQNHGSSTDGFTSVFMPILRSKVAKAMSKSPQERHQLAFLVWEACLEFWERTRTDPFPYGLAKWKHEHELGMSPPQEAAIMGSLINSHERLGDFLCTVGQIPKPEKLKVLRKLRARHDKAEKDQQDPPPPAPSSSKSPSIVGVPEDRIDDNERINVSSAALEHLEPDSSPSSHKKSTRGSVGKIPRQTTSIDNSASASDSDPHSSTDGPETGCVDETNTFGPSSLADFDNWAIPVNGALSSKATYREGPKLPTCGPWEIPLPRPMDPKLHIDPHISQIQVLLGGIRIQTNQLPPVLKVSLSASQRGEVLMDLNPGKDVESDLRAVRWKAYRVLLGWAEHLKRHAKPPAHRPLSLLAYVRSKLRAEGDHARDASMKRILECNGRDGVMFPGREYQMPALPARRDSRPLWSTSNVTDRDVEGQDQLGPRQTPLSCRSSLDPDQNITSPAPQRLSSDGAQDTPIRVAGLQRVLAKGMEMEEPENMSGNDWKTPMKRKQNDTLAHNAPETTSPGSNDYKRARIEPEHGNSASRSPIKREKSQDHEAVDEVRLGSLFEDDSVEHAAAIGADEVA